LNFDLSKEQEMIRREVRKFAQTEILPVASELDEKEEFSAELTRKMGEIGLFGTFVSEEFDGQGMDYLSYIIAVEEIARVDGSQAATIAAGNSLGIAPIYYFGTEAQKQKYLPKLCRGEALWGFGLTEPTAGSDAGGSKTTATQDGDFAAFQEKVLALNTTLESQRAATQTLRGQDVAFACDRVATLGGFAGALYGIIDGLVAVVPALAEAAIVLAAAAFIHARFHYLACVIALVAAAAASEHQPEGRQHYHDEHCLFHCVSSLSR